MKIKKFIPYIIVIFILIYFISGFFLPYEIDYKVSKHKIHEEYKNGIYKIKIDNNYNYTFFNKRKFGKKIVKSLEFNESDDYKCVYIVNKINQNYPLCKKDNNYYSYELINKDLFEDYKISQNDIIDRTDNIWHSDNISKKEYIAIWNYKGFYLLNNSKLETIDMFKKSAYNCDLCIRKDNKILLPDFDQSYQFNNFKVFNMENGKVSNISSKFDISYDSKYVGTYKNDIYLYDNKYEKVYKINIKKKDVSIVGSEEIGFSEIKNGKMIPVTKNDYISNKINFIESNSYFNVEGNKILLNNKNNFIYTNNAVKYIDQFNDNIYYVYEDSLYKYNFNNGSSILFYNFEFNFNNNIFVYNK